MLSTSVVRPFSKGVVSRVSRSSGFSPVYVQATEMTGMSIFGKMSVGVRRMTAGLSKRMRIARTTNVYGRLRANLTIHMNSPLLGYGVHRKNRRSAHAASSFPCSTKPDDDFHGPSFRPGSFRCKLRPIGLIYIALTRFIANSSIQKPCKLGMYDRFAKAARNQITLLDGADSSW